MHENTGNWLGGVLLVTCCFSVGCGPAAPADQAQIDEENAASSQQAVAQAPLNLQAKVQRKSAAAAALSNIMKKQAATDATIVQNLK